MRGTSAAITEPHRHREAFLAASIWACRSSTSPTRRIRRRPRISTTTSMLDPWESLKVNERRQLLGADNGQNGGGGPRSRYLRRVRRLPLSATAGDLPVGTGPMAAVTWTPIIGHEGAWAPDGLTYYGGDLRFTPPGATAATGQYYAVDTIDPTQPKLITTWVTGVAGAIVHGMSISDDGNRGYFVSLGSQRSAVPGLIRRNSRRQRAADLRLERDSGAQAESAGEAHQHAVLEGRLHGAAHDPDQDQGQAVRDLRRRRRLGRQQRRAGAGRVRCGHAAVPDGAHHRHQRRDATRRSSRS